MSNQLFHADELSEFWAYVEGLCAKACPPRFRDFELMDIYRLARNIVILDTESGSERLKVRFAGIHVVEMFGLETTGLFMDEIDLGIHKEDLLRIYNQSAIEGLPYWTCAKVETSVGQSAGPAKKLLFHYERLVVPFQDEHGSISNLVSILIRRPTAEGPDFEVEQVAFPKNM